MGDKLPDFSLGYKEQRTINERCEREKREKEDFYILKAGTMAVAGFLGAVFGSFAYGMDKSDTYSDLATNRENGITSTVSGPHEVTTHFNKKTFITNFKTNTLIIDNGYSSADNVRGFEGRKAFVAEVRGYGCDIAQQMAKAENERFLFVLPVNLESARKTGQSFKEQHCEGFVPH